MAFLGATRPSSPRDRRARLVSGHWPLGETSLLPAPFRPHSPLRKDSSRGIFSKKKSLKTPVVNEQLVLSQTQCGHVQTRRCPSADPRPNGASLFLSNATQSRAPSAAAHGGMRGIFWDVSSWKQLVHTKKICVLCKNNTPMAMRRGRDIPSNERTD